MRMLYYYIISIVVLFCRNMIVAVEEEVYANDGYKCYEEDFLDDQNSDTGSDNVSFEQIAKKMVDITADGGVKKQTMLHGMGEVIPPDANVLSNFVLHTSECF